MAGTIVFDFTKGTVTVLSSKGETTPATKVTLEGKPSPPVSN